MEPTGLGSAFRMAGAASQFIPGAGTMAGLGLSAVGTGIDAISNLHQQNKMQAEMREKEKKNEKLIRNMYDKQALDVYPTVGIESPYFALGGRVPTFAYGGMPQDQSTQLANNVQMANGNPMGHGSPGGDVPINNGGGLGGFAENNELLVDGNKVLSDRTGYANIGKGIAEAKGILEGIASNPNMEGLDKYQQGTLDRVLQPLQATMQNLDGALQATFQHQEEMKAMGGQMSPPQMQGAVNAPQFQFGGTIPPVPGKEEIPEWAPTVIQPLTDDIDVTGFNQAGNTYWNESTEKYTNFAKPEPWKQQAIERVQGGEKLNPDWGSLDYWKANIPNFDENLHWDPNRPSVKREAYYTPDEGSVPADFSNIDIQPIRDITLSNTSITPSAEILKGAVDKPNNVISTIGAGAGNIPEGQLDRYAGWSPMDAVPFVDNALIGLINQGMPDVPAPRLERLTAMDKEYNIEPQLQNIRNEQQAFNTDIDNSMTNANTAAANKLAAMSAGTNAQNTLWGEKENAETDLRNQYGANAQTVNQRNVQELNTYDLNKMSRDIAQQEAQTANIANATDDANKLLQDRRQEALDNQEAMLIGMQYGDTGVSEDMFRLGYFQNASPEFKEMLRKRYQQLGRG